MEISNQKRSKQIKQIFNITGVVVVLVGLVLLWLKNDLAFFITAGIFAAYVGIAQFANLCYVNFSAGDGKILIRYYPVISILKKEYGSIEFPEQMLVDFKIEKSMGLADLNIVIRTKRGIAEYPSISLSALRKAEIEQIRDILTDIKHINRKGA